MVELTPAAQALAARVQSLLKKLIDTQSLIDADIQAVMEGMKPSDFDRLRPPMDAVYWTDDPAFCRRLAAYVFCVSDETLDEMPAKYYPHLLKIVAVNFIVYMGGAIPN